MKKLCLFFFSFFLILQTLHAQDKPTLTVLDFQTNNVSEGDMKSIIAFLSASLFDTGLYRVIDTAQRETILKEMEFSSSGCTDESCQLEIGRLLSAEFIVVGDIAQVGNRFMFTARVIETETSETASTSKAIYTGLDDLIDGMTVFAAELAGTAGLTDPETVAAAEEATDNAKDMRVVKEREPLSVRDIFAWSTLGVGVAAAGTGAVLAAGALDYKHSSVDTALEAYNNTEVDDFGEQTPTEYYEELWEAYLGSFDTFKGKALTALIVTGTGVLSLGASAALFFIPEKETAQVSFYILPTPDACSFRFTLRL